MLPKKHRLNKREDFATVFARGSFVSIQEGMAIKFLKTDSPSTRIGFPIGKNFSKKAVERNYAKRILRSATFPLLKKIRPGFDIVVLVKPTRKEFGLVDISKELEKVFAKANLLI